MSKKGKNKSSPISMIFLFISKQEKQMIDEKNRLWLWVSKTHGQKISGTALTVNFDDKRERLTVFWKEEKIYDHKATYGFAFEIRKPQQKPKKIHITMLRYPHGVENVVPWLCGYTDKNSRTTDRSAANKIRQNKRKELGANIFTPGENHIGKYHIFNSVIINGTRHLTVAYADKRMDKNEISLTLRTHADPRYPAEFISTILQREAGFQPHDYLICG